MFRNIITILFLLIYNYSYASGPYIGADVGIKTLQFEEGYGDNLFAASLPFGNIFVGFKFNEYFGIEGGYESTTTEKRENSLYYGDKALGITLNSQSPRFYQVKYSTTNKMFGWHAGVIFDYSLNHENSVLLCSYIGIKNTKIDLIRNRLELQFQTSLNTDSLNKHNKKNIFLLSFGLKYLLNKHFTIKWSITFENTSNINPYGFNANNQRIEARLKNTFSNQIGIIIN